MNEKKCIRCLTILPISKFTVGHNKTDKSISYVRSVCYECQYGWNIFWKKTTYKEKLERLTVRFNARVIKKDGCWDFHGATNSSGYFEMRAFDKKHWKAHRLSWLLHKGVIPDDLLVLHKCDNRRCTNPEHLFLGTNLDNVRDREFKGRGNQRKGEAHNKAVLKVGDIKKIKRLLRIGVTATKIARDFGVGSSTIYNIKYGNTWSEVW